MKLLYVLGSYFPAQSGGPNNTIHWQAKYLTKEGVDVSVASLKTGLTQENIDRFHIRLNSENQIDGVKAYYFDYLINRYCSIKFYIWLIFNIKRFDFVQLTSYFFPISVIAAFLCELNQVPFSVAPRGELEDNALIYHRHLKKIIHGIFLKYFYSKAKFVLVTSAQELKFSKKFFHSTMRFELVPNYINISQNGPLSKDEILNKKNILYLGRVHPKKGIDNLINAYARLDGKLAKKHSLLIVGKGDKRYVYKLKRLAYKSKYAGSIQFLGHKQGTNKRNIYREARVLVLPSHSENFGNVVLESLSFSTPVISSKFTPWAMLEKKECGFWVDNTPIELSKKIQYLLEMNDIKYFNYAKNSFDFVNNGYNIEKNIGHLLRVYQEYRGS